KILSVEQMPEGVAAANISDVDGHPITDIGDVGKVAAVFGDHAVEQQHVRAEGDETAGDCRPDEAQTAGDQRSGAALGFKPWIRAQSQSFLVVDHTPVAHTYEADASADHNVIVLRAIPRVLGSQRFC